MNNFPKFPKCTKIESKPSKFCPGCGYGIILKELGFVVDELGLQEKTVLATDIGCNLLAWDYFNFGTTQTHHGRAVQTMVGYKMAKPRDLALVLTGDGGAYAIGLGGLIWAAIRNNPITVIVVNNTLYAMTGGQLAPTTIPDEVTTTTPSGRKTEETGRVFFGPEFLKEIAPAKAYLARTSVKKPLLIYEYLKKAIENQLKNKTFSLVEVLSYCPLNWHTNAGETLEYMQKIEQIFPQGEF